MALFTLETSILTHFDPFSRYVGTQIRLKPLHGWGLDTARSEQFSNQTVECKFKDKTTGDYYPSVLPASPLHPHNAALQWWLELGLIGVLIASFLVMQIPWKLRNWGSKPKRATAFACFSTTTIVALISYGIWQNWWISTMWFAVTYGYMLLDPEKEL